MAVTYVVTFTVSKGKIDDFHRLLGGVLGRMKDEATFVEAILHGHPTEPNVFMLYETWQSHEEVMAVQMHRPYRDEWKSAQPEVLSHAFDVTMWSPIEEFRPSKQTPGLSELQGRSPT